MLVAFDCTYYLTPKLTVVYRTFTSMMLLPEIWNRILYFAFIDKDGPDIETLDNCRKVCREWNEMIKRSVWLKPTKEWGIITKSMIEKYWSWRSIPSDKMISHAKDLGKSKKTQIFIHIKIMIRFCFL